MKHRPAPDTIGNRNCICCGITAQTDIMGGAWCYTCLDKHRPNYRFGGHPKRPYSRPRDVKLVYDVEDRQYAWKPAESFGPVPEPRPLVNLSHGTYTR